MTYGGVILSLRTPDRHGHLDDIVLGFDTLQPYTEPGPYFGAIIGRYGNRIAGGRFTLDGETFELARNNGPNHLHGGVRGFDRVVWQAEPFETGAGVGVALRYTSPAGEEGYPGTLRARVSYTLGHDDTLAVGYHATTDQATPVNLTQHSYFNLAGPGRGDVLGHELQLNASAYTPVDVTMIPTGRIAPVEATPFDFRTPTTIGARIDAGHEQLERARGYDHNFVLDGPRAAERVAARVTEPTTGRVLELHTTEPGVQLYTANYLDGTLVGKGRAFGPRSGLCLETQHFPDSPNQPAFPSTILRPGEEYRSRTIFAFGVTD